MSWFCPFWNPILSESSHLSTFCWNLEALKCRLLSWAASVPHATLCCHLPESSFYLNHIPDLGILDPPQGAEANEESLLFSSKSWLLMSSWLSLLPSISAPTSLTPFTPQKTLELMVLGGEWGWINRVKLWAVSYDLDWGLFFFLFCFYKFPSLHWNPTPMFEFIMWPQPTCGFFGGFVFVLFF